MRSILDTHRGAVAPRWAGYAAALFGLEYAVGKAIMAVRGELGVPGHPAPREAYEHFSGDIAVAQLGNAALGLVSVGLALALVQRWGRRVPAAVLAAGAAVSLLSSIAGMVVVAASLAGLRRDDGQWGIDSLVLGVIPLVAWAVLAVAALRAARGGGPGPSPPNGLRRPPRAARASGLAPSLARLARRSRGAMRAATRPGWRAALAATSGCVAYGVMKLDWALGGELLMRQTALPDDARHDMLDRAAWTVAGHWASVGLAAVGVGLAVATARAGRVPRLLIAGLPVLIGVLMLARAGWGAANDIAVLTGAAGDADYPAGWDLGLWSPFFATWGAAWIAAARATRRSSHADRSPIAAQALPTTGPSRPASASRRAAGHPVHRPKRRRARYSSRLKATLRRWPSWVAGAAAAWSIAYTALALFWALGGAGFPFGEGDPEAADMGSLFVGAHAGVLAPTIAALCLGASFVAVTIMRSGHGPLPRRVVLVAGWGMAAILLLAVPDVRLMRDFAYVFAGFMGFVEKFDWPAANQILCVTGGLLWAGATLAYQRRTRAACVRCGVPLTDTARSRDEAIWARRGRWFTLAAVLLSVPYEITRWAWALGLPLGVTHGADMIEHWTTQARVGMFVMGAMPLLGGLLTHGLSRPWGEVVPHWIPRFGGKTIPVAAAVVPAALVTILIVTAATSLQRFGLNVALGRVSPAAADVQGWGAWAPAQAWLPWGLALGAATYAYWRRRRGRCG